MERLVRVRPPGPRRAEADAIGTPGEIDVGAYTDLDPHTLRSQALDCPVGAVDPACPGGTATGIGGYTFGDFGKVAGVPEVHADGEIWAETLWDLREALEIKTADPLAASDLAEILISDGMRISPPEPTMLDMRNSILAADEIDFGGASHDLIWDVFRNRGMGYFAAATDGADTRPVEDFSAPPDADGPAGTVTGVVTDAGSGLPLQGVRAGLAGHTTARRWATTWPTSPTPQGRYTIEHVPAGTYPKLAFFGDAGYNPAVARNVAVSGGQSTTRDQAWSATGRR